MNVKVYSPIDEDTPFKFDSARFVLAANAVTEIPEAAANYILPKLRDHGVVVTTDDTLEADKAKAEEAHTAFLLKRAREHGLLPEQEPDQRVKIRKALDKRGIKV